MLQAFGKSAQYPFLKDAACRIIRNISRHPRNRTTIYKTELSLKADEFYEDILTALRDADKSLGVVGETGGSTSISPPVDGTCTLCWTLEAIGKLRVAIPALIYLVLDMISFTGR